MSGARPDPTRDAEPAPAIRISAEPGASPLGAIFGGIGLVGAGIVWLLRLDHVPVKLCVFKGLTGMACPTCGSTRAAALLFGLDPTGALLMNPLATLIAVGMAAWALADVALMPRRRALRLGLSRKAARVARIVALVVFLANWVYLLAVGR